MSLPVSVIIPTYNRPELTAQAVYSIYSQTKPPREILVIDDNSGFAFVTLKNLCLQVANRFANSPVQLKILTLCRHLGMPGAVRNIGMLQASEEWFAFLDSDDVWLPQKLELQWQHVLQSQAKLIHCRELWLRFGKREKSSEQLAKQLAPYLQYQKWFMPLYAEQPLPEIISQKKHKHLREGSSKELWAHALKKCILGPSTLLMHRSICTEVGYFEPKIQIAEDYEYFLRLIARFNVAYCSEFLVAKRDGIPNANETQLSHRFSYIEPFRLVALDKLMISSRAKQLLSDEQKYQAIEELQRKLKICLSGASKRLTKAKQSNLVLEIQQIQVQIEKLRSRQKFWQTEKHLL